MKAQLVKNAVIVPTGAKGGFYPKQLPPASNRDAWLAEGTESYRIFIRSLLSVTDNIVDDKVVHPDRRRDPRRRRSLFRGRRRQGHRDLLRRRQRHRARAQLLARRRFRQRRLQRLRPQGDGHHRQGRVDLGPAPLPRNGHRRSDATRSRVAGCGDMSGDVFGNGMLLSKAIKLVAAFDHRHIFIDPDPDPATSWKERKRHVRAAALELGRLRPQADVEGRRRSSRAREKSIALSAEARAALGIEADDDRPDEPDQRDPQGAGRPALVRRHRHLRQGVDAEPCRRRRSRQRRAPRRRQRSCAPRSIGEGANLGITQAGRIEFAEHGGRINTDFIDNSAGVDCSDNEVNIKIPLNREMREGRLTFEQAQRAAREDDRRGRRARARGQPAADARAVDRRSAAAPRALPGACPHDRDARSDAAGSTARSRGWQTSEELLRRAQDEPRPDPARARGRAVDVQARAAGRGRGAASSPTTDDGRPQLFDAFPKPMRKAACRRDPRPPAAQRDPRHQGRQPPRQPARPERRVRPDRGGRRVARRRSIAAFLVAERLLDLDKLWSEIEQATLPETVAHRAVRDRRAQRPRASVATSSAPPAARPASSSCASCSSPACARSRPRRPS